MFSLFILFLLPNLVFTSTPLFVYPSEVDIKVGNSYDVVFYTNGALDSDVQLTFNETADVHMNKSIIINKNTKRGILTLNGNKVVSRAFIEISTCKSLSNLTSDCPFDIHDAFVRLSVFKSHIIDWLVNIFGWSYFFAWSISFYPQIFLNFKRKSVVGLNFDFLLLNLIGFTSYAFYNLLLYYADSAKTEYQIAHPRSPPPVLLNDVVFAVHAVAACSITVLQCFIYEKAEQKVSLPAIIFGAILCASGAFFGVLTIFKAISILLFVNLLSYIKMAITLMKYFPQAYFNYIRQSTIGWSIGNVLLDFTGGSLDILQMIFQAFNVDDWSAFYGNPVKFGLGLVSIVFDIVFIIQHYLLYTTDVSSDEYDGIDNEAGPLPTANYEATTNREDDVIINDNE